MSDLSDESIKSDELKSQNYDEMFFHEEGEEEQQNQPDEDGPN